MFEHYAPPADMTTPTRPSEIERQKYYFGLALKPLLVAGSNSDSTAWSPREVPYGPWPRIIRKYLSVVGQHGMTEKWNSGGLRDKITQAIEATQLDWSTIDVLRLGFEKDEDFPDGHLDHPVTLFISVTPQSTTWEDAYPVAMTFKRILKDAGIHDVECEIKEGRLVLNAGETSNLSITKTPSSTLASDQSVPASSSDDQLHPAPTESNDQPAPAPTASDEHEQPALPITTRLVPFTPDQASMGFHHVHRGECIGGSLSPYNRLSRSGTKGPYLRLRMENGTEKMVTLICRHVVSAVSGAPENMEEESGLVSSPIIQPSNKGFTELCENFVDEKQLLVEKKGREERNVMRQNREPTAADQEQIDNIDRQIDRIEQTLTQLEAFKDPKSRIIGHVLSAPSSRLQTTIKGRKWWRDWALVELDHTKHQSPLSALPNNVLMSNLVLSTNFRGLRRHGIFQKLTDDDHLGTLDGMLTEDEIFKHPDLVVGKFGAMTGLTYGVSNDIMSVVRHPSGNDSKVSDEWCIIGIGGLFSEPGDSGSVVWDRKTHQIGGIITAGSGDAWGRESKLDVTYATPIERLLDDIRESGFNVELP